MRFIDVLGYREITLKSDTEPSNTAFRSCVAEMCNAEVNRRCSERRQGHTGMFLRGIIRTIK